jgi:hypothetical protein
MAVSEDEFVELDEQGNPRRKPGRSARPGRPQAPIRHRKPARRGPVPPPVAAPAAAPVEAAATEAAAPAAPIEVIDAELDLEDTVDVAPAASATASVRRRPAPGATGPRRGQRQ